MGTHRFAMAPMSASVAALTWVMAGVPAVLVWGASRSPPPISTLLLGTVAFVGVLFAAIGLWWRPSAFELGAAELTIQWPLRRMAFALHDVEQVEKVSFDELRARYGRGLRVGAGGLFGAFGRYVTPSATLRMYVSRLDELVLVRFASGPAWLISPAHAGAFVQALQHAVTLVRQPGAARVG